MGRMARSHLTRQLSEAHAATGFSGYEGVAEGRIHFAGEHTTQDFQGFMEGAVLSGESCAAEVHSNG